jgi:hypothetical protein
MANPSSKTTEASASQQRHRQYSCLTIFCIILFILLACLVQFLDILPPNFRIQFNKPNNLNVSLESDLLDLPSQIRQKCPLTPFTSVQILSRNPQIILIENFITPIETAFLLKLAYRPITRCPRFQAHYSLSQLTLE